MILIGFRFGIEFAPEVVQADGSVEKLAWRICNAKKVLVSFTTYALETTTDKIRTGAI